MEERRKQFLEEKQQFMKDLQNKKPEDFILHYKGYQYPTTLCKPETFQALETFEARRDDVMLVAYPKCGFNWVIQLLQNIASCVRTEDEDKETGLVVPILEFGTPKSLQEMKQHPSPRVFGTHLYYDEIPASFFENKTKMIVVFRNPKDTAVSYFHFCNGNPLLPNYSSWDDFFHKFMTGDVFWSSYFNHALIWDKHMDDDNVMVITFEELKQNLTEGVKQIAEFFGFSLSEEQIQSVADRGTFRSMKENSKTTHPGISDVFFRKGEVGDWVNHFNEVQNKEMDAKFEQCLAGTKLGAKLKYDVYCKA